MNNKFSIMVMYHLRQGWSDNNSSLSFFHEEERSVRLSVENHSFIQRSNFNTVYIIS
eukprot:CCRYP_010135-RA/>CCRYP_010135-RA protein AED:0.45 eAED:0.45 QI:119/1/1/1/0/0/2/41/56